MTQKSPYELRAELLTLAKSFLDAEYQRQVDLATVMYQQVLKNTKATQGDLAEFTPQMYNFGDIVTKANELYSFVQKK